MSTASLRRDHDLIEKVLKSMAATVQLFVMAEARLQDAAAQVSGEMDQIERRQLEEIGRERAHYERMVSDLDWMVQDASRSV